MSHCVALESFVGKGLFFFFGLSADPTVWVAMSH